MDPKISTRVGMKMIQFLRSSRVGHITAMFVSEVWGMNLLTATISQVGSIANRKSSERFENHWRSKYFIPEIRCSIRENANYHDGKRDFSDFNLFNFIFILLHFFSVETAILHLTIISFCKFFFLIWFFF